MAAAAPKGILGRIKYFFLGDKLDKDKLAQLGMGAFASYGTRVGRAQYLL